MIRVASLGLALLLASVAAGAAAPAKRAPGHQFGVIGNSFADGGNERRLLQSLAENAEAELSFVIVNGIKDSKENCGDELYMERRDLLELSERPLIVVPAASDWSDCRNSSGRPAALERLTRLRELLYADASSLGVQKLPLTRLSASAQFRGYAENSQWVVGKVLYATINLPSNNNRYLAEAGRNSEFEDRQVANRFWLHRVFAQAKRRKLEAIVLFSEGDLKALSQESGLRALLGRSGSREDGYAAPRKQLQALASKYEGKVLLIDSAPLAKDKAPAIEWRDNIGHLSVGQQAMTLHFTPGAHAPFTLKRSSASQWPAPEKAASAKDARR
jgi:hypothetical protein